MLLFHYFLAINDVDACRQLIYRALHLNALQIVDSSADSRNVGSDCIDARAVRHNHHCAIHYLAIENHTTLRCVELCVNLIMPYLPFVTKQALSYILSIRRERKCEYMSEGRCNIPLRICGICLRAAHTLYSSRSLCPTRRVLWESWYIAAGCIRIR